MKMNCFERFCDSDVAVLPSKRIVITGLVVLTLLLAGCGGNTDGGETTMPISEGNGSESTMSEQSARTATATDTRNSVSPTALPMTIQSKRTVATSTPGLDIRVEPSATNATDATLILHSTMTASSATDGIETIAVDTGGGLDLSNITVANVSTAGIDEDGNLPGNLTDGSLVANVESGIELTDNGEGFVIPFDGNRSIERGDEIVVVIDGGVATGKAGSYTFSLTVNEGPSQMDRYNITEA